MPITSLLLVQIAMWSGAIAAFISVPCFVMYAWRDDPRWLLCFAVPVALALGCMCLALGLQTGEMLELRNP